MALDSGYVYCGFECIVCEVDENGKKRTKTCRIKWCRNCNMIKRKTVNPG